MFIWHSGVPTVFFFLFPLVYAVGSRTYSAAIPGTLPSTEASSGRVRISNSPWQLGNLLQVGIASFLLSPLDWVQGRKIVGADHANHLLAVGPQWLHFPFDCFSLNPIKILEDDLYFVAPLRRDLQDQSNTPHADYSWVYLSSLLMRVIWRTLANK